MVYAAIAILNSNSNTICSTITTLNSYILYPIITRKIPIHHIQKFHIKFQHGIPNYCRIKFLYCILNISHAKFQYSILNNYIQNSHISYSKITHKVPIHYAQQLPC
jgi:hypothetical protein